MSENWKLVFLFISASWSCLDLAFFVLVLVRYREFLWGKLLAIGFLLGFVCNSVWFLWNVGLMFLLSLNPVTNILFLVSHVLLLLGVASLPISLGRAAAPPASIPQVSCPQELVFRKRNPLLVILLLIVTMNIYWVFWLYHTVKELKQLRPRTLTFSPGQAVGFLFIPLFNLFWFIYLCIRLPQAIGDLRGRFAPAETTGHFATGFVTVLLIGSCVANTLGGVDWRFLLGGEIVVVTAFAYMQSHINAMWRSMTPRT
jgi:hypothetical protein